MKYPRSHAPKAFYVIALTAYGILFAVLGCSGRNNDAALQRAWAYAEANAFEQSHTTIREYTLAHPYSPAAHFLLGRCYANRPEPELTRAKGEFDMAAFLLQDTSRMDVPDAAKTVQEFQSDIHYETALVLVRIVETARKAGITSQATAGILDTALHHVQEGMSLTPASVELASLEQYLTDALEHIRNGDRSSPPPPERYFI